MKNLWINKIKWKFKKKMERFNFKYIDMMQIKLPEDQRVENHQIWLYIKTKFICSVELDNKHLTI